MQYNEHLVFEVYIPGTELEDYCKVELKVTVDNPLEGQTTSLLLALLLNHTKDLFDLGGVKDGVGEVDILQISFLEKEETALKMTLEV